MKIPKWVLFNFFTRSALSQVKIFPLNYLNLRIQSALSDLWYCMSVAFPFLILTMISVSLIQLFYQTNNQFPSSIIIQSIWIIVLIGIIFNKDFVNGRSAAKRKFGFVIVDNKSNLPSYPIRCLFRNITMIIWPIEVLFLFFNPERRIGDFIANTKVIEVEKIEAESLMEEMRKLEHTSIYSFLISGLIAIILAYITFSKEI